MDRESYRKQLLRCGSHKRAVTNSNGSKEAWRWLRKNKWLGLPPITEGKFGAVINAINSLYQKRLLQGKDIILPHYMGRIELRKRQSSVSLVGGELITTMPIDWKKTIDLWYEDKESRDRKYLVKRNPGDVFQVYYNKRKAKFNNKEFYKFIPTRSLRLKLKELINNGRIDAFNF